MDLGSPDIWLPPYVLSSEMLTYCGQCKSFHLGLLSSARATTGAAWQCIARWDVRQGGSKELSDVICVSLGLSLGEVGLVVFKAVV